MDEQSKPDEDGFRREVGNRLRRTREAFEMQQKEFAAAAGIAFNTYNQYEQGARLMRLENALALCNCFDLTLDWIYRGEPGGLQLHVWKRIRTTEP